MSTAETAAETPTANDDAASVYVDVQETVFPDGRVVPAFRVAKYIAGRGTSDTPVSTADADPWTRINFHESKRVAAAAGLSLLTASQAAAIAYQIINQDENWTGGKVGEGNVFMGLHKDTVDEAQPGSYESEDADERRWHVLANGERIYDFAGNAYQWMFDDLHGDENGLVGAASIPADSPLLTLPTAPSMKNGMGWRPTGPAKWSGDALVRGGRWRSGDGAGVFDLFNYWPELEYDNVGFRCTKPIGL